jgi:hypothetical protein
MYRVLAVMIIASIATIACSSPSDSSTRVASGTGGGAASAVKACDLLTLAEIKQATGADMGAGLLQTTDTQASCDWSSLDGSPGASGVGVIVQDLDDSLFRTMASSEKATAVIGIGEQAFKGFPHSGDLSVKQGKYEVDVAIADFKHDNATVDAASLSLMKLVLSRL